MLLFIQIAGWSQRKVRLLLHERERRYALQPGSSSLGQGYEERPAAAIVFLAPGCSFLRLRRGRKWLDRPLVSRRGPQPSSFSSWPVCQAEAGRPHRSYNSRNCAKSFKGHVEDLAGHIEWSKSKWPVRAE